MDGQERISEKDFKKLLDIKKKMRYHKQAVSESETAARISDQKVREKISKTLLTKVSRCDKVYRLSPRGRQGKAP